MKTAVAHALLLLGAGVFSGCEVSARRIHLVTLTELTGPHAALGNGIRNGAGLALEEYRGPLENAGWRVELTAYDSRGSAQDFSATVLRIASQTEAVCAVIHAQTEAVLSAVPTLRTAGIPAVFPAETSPIPQGDPPAGTLWLSADDLSHGAADAEWAAASGFTEIFLLSEPAPHSQTITDGFLQRAKALSLHVAKYQLSPERYSAAWMLSFNTAAPQLIYYSGSPGTIAPLLADLERAGFAGSFFYAESEAENPVPASFKSNSIRFIFSAAAFPSEYLFRDETFSQKYRRLYESDPPPLSELGFDASALCLRPLMHPGAGDPREAIRSYWRAGGSWEGFGGTYSLDGRRTCRTWIFASLLDAPAGEMPIFERSDPAGTHPAC